MNKKIYSEKQIYISAALSGPITSGILIYKNYLAFGKKKEANIALIVTFFLTAILSYILIQMPEYISKKIPSIFYSTFYGLLIYLYFKFFKNKEMKEAFQNGIQKASNWNVFGFSLLGVLIYLGMFLGVVSVINEQFYEGKVFNVNGNELYYNEDTVPLEDVKKLAAQFKTRDFFGKDYENIAKLEIVNHVYYITMVVGEEFWTDDEFINSLTTMKWLLKIEFNKKIVLKLESISLSGIRTYKEIEGLF